MCKEKEVHSKGACFRYNEQTPQGWKKRCIREYVVIIQARYDEGLNENNAYFLTKRKESVDRVLTCFHTLVSILKNGILGILELVSPN